MKIVIVVLLCLCFLSGALAFVGTINSRGGEDDALAMLGWILCVMFGVLAVLITVVKVVIE